MPRDSVNHTTQTATITTATSAVWDDFIPIPDAPEGTGVRTTYPTNPDGVDVMLQQWKAGAGQPPHSHPGDDMTVIVEGKMAVQFYTRDGDDLVPDGDKEYLNEGDIHYIRANRIHEVEYIEDCKLVYVHDKAFAFNPA
jgi:quercetin dioxygenase-like cupin family protein